MLIFDFTWLSALLGSLPLVLLVGMILQPRRKLGPPRAARPRPREDVEFEAAWPALIPTGDWSDFYVYISNEEGREAAANDLRKRIGEASDFFFNKAEGRLARGAQLRIVPDVDGVTFNPASARVDWLESWQRADFRMQGNANGERAGRVSIFAGALLVGEIDVVVNVRGAGSREFKRAKARAYRNIFVSYARKDRDVVDRLEQAYTALGDTYLRDTTILRSGEKWEWALRKHIAAADVFQLCWSDAARRSRFVRRELRFALALRRANFIRAFYWREPMPAPPPELADTEFKYVPLP